MSAGQLEGLGADERRHHVEEEDEGHDEGDRQEQHGSGCAGGRVTGEQRGEARQAAARGPAAERGTRTAAARLRRGSWREGDGAAAGPAGGSRRRRRRRARPPLRHLIGCRRGVRARIGRRGVGGTGRGGWSLRVFSAPTVAAQGGGKRVPLQGAGTGTGAETGAETGAGSGGGTGRAPPVGGAGPAAGAGAEAAPEESGEGRRSGELGPCEGTGSL